VSDVPSESAGARASPAWVLLLLGGLGTDTLLSRSERALDPRWVAAAEGVRAEVDPLRMSARELRRIPGVGERRALELVRARELHARRGGLSGEDAGAVSGPDEAFRWSSVRGVGPVTEERISRFAREHGVEAGAPGGLEVSPASTELQLGVESEARIQALADLVERILREPAVESRAEDPIAPSLPLREP